MCASIGVSTESCRPEAWAKVKCTLKKKHSATASCLCPQHGQEESLGLAKRRPRLLPTQGIKGGGAGREREKGQASSTRCLQTSSFFSFTQLSHEFNPGCHVQLNFILAKSCQE